MLSPQHVEALAYERQKELLETAERLRARRRHPTARTRGPVPARRPLRSRAAGWFRRLTHQPSPAPDPRPAAGPAAPTPDATSSPNPVRPTVDAPAVPDAA